MRALYIDFEPFKGLYLRIQKHICKCHINKTFSYRKQICSWSQKYLSLNISFFLLTRYQSKISGIGVTPLTSSTVHWHTQSQRRHSSKFTMAFKVGLHLCLLSPSGLTPWRVPAGDVVAGQLPGRGSSGKMALSSRSFAGVETCVMLRAS